jgi:acetate kinase
MVVDRDTVRQLEQFIPLAPLHQPHNLNGIRAIARVASEVPQVACFDTAFHRTNPPVAQTFAIPRALTAEGVKRYGFHGLSYEFIAGVLPQHTERAEGRTLVAHLGNGSSMCAMRERRSLASTMGFTAIDGLMMGTRTGAVDPGVLLYLMDNKGMGSAELTRLLYKESGLLGVSGISQDMRTLLASDQPEAEEAIDLYCYRIVREVGSLAAAIGGLDVLVFTGGIGEHAAEVRRRVCAQLGWLGVSTDPAANAGDKLRISTAASAVDVLVIPTNEEWMIARHAQRLLSL